MPIWRQPPQPQQRAVKTIVVSAIQLSLSDTIAIVDAFSKVSEFNPSLADSIAIADVISKGIAIPRAETLTIADSITTKDIGLNKADAITIADLLAKVSEFNYSILDAITIADAISKAIGIPKSDTITIVDLAAYLKALALYLSDTISITDVLSKNIGITKADIITITEGTERIMGSANVSVEDVADIDYFYLSKFTAERSGDVIRIKIYCQGTLNVKVAMYEDNAGEPGDLMNAVDTAQAIVDGWNEIVFPATAIVQGTDYWLAFNSG